MIKNLLLTIVIICAITIHSNAQTISAGGAHSHSICLDSTVMAWGYNYNQQLGDGTSIDRSLPVSVLTLTGIIAVEAGSQKTIALKADGTVWQCGNYQTPTQVVGLSNIIKISTSLNHFMALKSDSTVWMWGVNGSGELGDSTNVSNTTPFQLAGFNNVVEISAGASYSMFLKSDGTVWACGVNNTGQLGDGTTINKNYPVQVLGINDVHNISSGYFHSIALKNDGTVWCWGANINGQLGDGSGSDQLTPVQTNGLTNVIKIAAGNNLSLAIKSDSTIWGWGLNSKGALGYWNLGSVWSPVQGFTAITDAIDIATSVASPFTLILRSDKTLWSAGFNDYGQLGNGMTSTAPNNVAGQITLCDVMFNSNTDHNLNGKLYNDLNTDCIYQNGGIELPFKPSLILNPDRTLVFPNDSGNYEVGLNNLINYTLEPIIPHHLANLVKSVCPSNYSIYLNANDPQDTTGFDFGFEFSPCPLLTTDISSDRRRRCSQNNTSVKYCNEGFADATNVQVHVEFPDYVDLVSADHAYTIDADGNYVFNIGALAQGDCGTINIIDSVACINGITGLTQCTKAWITPINTCADSLDPNFGPWDKSSIKVLDGACIGDTTVRLVIWNHGSGDMNSISEYRIYSDNQLGYTGSFQLVSGDSLVIEIAANGTTIRIEADQHPLCPGNSHPRTTIKGCGNGGFPLTFGLLNDSEMDDADVDIEIDCLEIRDSYDPNDKKASPEGITANRYVKPNTPLDYVIRFQNTGSDTAYTVVVVDTLSADLDLSTIQWGVGSHPYTINLSGQGRPVVTFTFNNINLPDSTTDEANSQGFVKFKISPDTSITNGTVIHNEVDIYFDFNLPIRTNDAWVTIFDTTVIGTPIFVNQITDQTISICQGDSVLLNAVYQSSAGIYYDTLQSINGNDSLFSTTLIVNPVFSSNQNQSICQGDSLLIYGLHQNNTGVYYDSLQTINGCDSILSTTLTVDPLPSISITAFNPDTICINGPLPTLPSATPMGGSYSGTGVVGSNFDPSLVGIGTHDVIYTYTDANSCINSDTTTITVDVCAGIDNVRSDFGILIYPNPSTGLFTIEKPSDLNKEVQIRVLDATSKLVVEKTIPLGEQKMEVDITAYSSGVYYLQLIVEEEVFVKQILKK